MIPAEAKSGEDMNELSGIAISKYEIQMKKRLKILRTQEGD